MSLTPYSNACCPMGQFFLRLRLPLACLALVAVAGAAYLAAGPGPQVTDAANAFLDSLDEKQKSLATMGYDDPARLEWHFIPKKERKGLQLRDMSEKQQKLAMELLATTLSEVGYDKAETIMDLEQILNKLEGENARFLRDNLRYFYTVFGTPSEKGKWGLSIEGHHLSLNFVIEDNQVVSHTPQFFGANPALVQKSYGVGPEEGTRVLAKEEVLAFELMNSLSAAQQRVALLSPKAPADIRAAGDAQAAENAYAGLAASQMSPEQQRVLRALIESYTQSMPEAIAKRRIREIRQAGFENIVFTWAGATKPGIGHYYRVEGPSFQIEFCNVQPDAAGNSANHIHAVWRDPSGDFDIALF